MCVFSRGWKTFWSVVCKSVSGMDVHDFQMEKAVSFGVTLKFQLEGMRENIAGVE